jgi:hypothetical protein
MRNLARVAALAVIPAILVSCSSAADRSGDGPSASPTPVGSTPETSSYADNGVSFDYPSDWQLLDQTGATSSTGGDQLWTQALGLGLSEASVVIVSAYQLRLDVSKVPPEQLKTEIDATLDQLTQQAGGSRVGGLETTTLGSLHGYEATIDATSPAGSAVQSRVVFAFDGDLEYYVNCQYEPDARSAILDGCDAIQESFAVD